MEVTAEITTGTTSSDKATTIRIGCAAMPNFIVGTVAVDIEMISKSVGIACSISINTKDVTTECIDTTIATTEIGTAEIGTAAINVITKNRIVARGVRHCTVSRG